MSDFMGIIQMIDAQLLRRHNNTATEFFEAGQQAERERINTIIDSFIENTDYPEVEDRLQWLKDVINGNYDGKA